MAAFRQRQVPPPNVYWWGKTPQLTTVSRTVNADGTPALGAPFAVTHAPLAARPHMADALRGGSMVRGKPVR